MKVAVVGAGWAGCAAAVEALRLGHQVTLFEAARTLGGRARRIDAALNGAPVTLDNGQHILIGAYSETLQLMADVGLDVDASLLRMPLTLQFPNGDGLRLPSWPAPLDALGGILRAKGWSWADKLSLLKLSVAWQLRRFQCGPLESVASLCSGVSPSVMRQLIEPLCVSALNTPPDRASGQVFLRVMRDALFARSGGSNLLLPRVDLSALLPDAAASWLQSRGAEVRSGTRIQSLQQAGNSQWFLQADANAQPQLFDAVLMACPPLEASRLLAGLPCEPWRALASGLRHEAITTVYAHADHARLAQPMLALQADAANPAQFVFDRAWLGGPAGLLAFVVSASVGDRASLGQQVLDQAARQLGLTLQLVKTVVEKRATFACTPGLQRPGMAVLPGLLACGDCVDGPYPATLEQAVRSGLDAARSLR